MVYGCDLAWWEHRRGLAEFKGLKVCWSGNGLRDHPEVRRVEIAWRSRGEYLNEMVFGPPDRIGGGGNSGFQAVNLAVNLGAQLLLLVGFDMTDRGGVHWYGRNRWNRANNPDQSNFRKWKAAFESQAPRLRAAGVEVLNASRDSALTCFDKVTVDGFLQRLRRVRPARG